MIDEKNSEIGDLSQQNLLLAQRVTEAETLLEEAMTQIEALKDQSNGSAKGLQVNGQLATTALTTSPESNYDSRIDLKRDLP